MADTEKKVTVAIDGNADGITAAMAKAKAAAEESSRGILNAYSQLGGAFKSLQGVFTASLAIFAGGSAFKSAIDTTKEWAGETGKLSKQLQITTAEATAYQAATAHLGIESSTLVEASDKLARGLQKNETAFKALGLETRNQNGSWRSTGELLPEVMDKLRGIHNVTQQNIAGQQLFGKGWSDLRGLLKLTSTEMEHARQKARELNLETDPKQVAAYKQSMNDIKLIMTSLSIQVGNLLLPVLTDLGKWFGEVGPYVIGAFSTALKLVETALISVWAVLKSVMAYWTGLIHAMIDASQGNWKEAWGTLKEIGTSMFEPLKEGWDKAAALWTPKTPSAQMEKGDGGQLIDFEKAKHERILQEWEAQLEERKLKLEEQAAAEGRFAQMSKADEIAFWRDKLAIAKAGTTEQLAVRKRLAELSLTLLKELYEAELATLHAREEAFKTNLTARRALVEEEARLVAQKYGEGSKEFQAVQAKLTALAREAAAQRLQVAQIAAEQHRNLQLAEIQSDEAAQQLQVQLGLKTQAQALQGEAQFEQRLFEIKSDALRDRLNLLLLDPDRNPVEIARTHAEIEQLELQHQQRLQQIKGQMTLTDLQPMLTTFRSVEQGLTQMGTTLLTNWRNVGAQLRRTMAQISQTIITELVVKPLVAKAAGWLKERALTMAGVQADAVKAGTGAASSQASIPYVGPILAVAAMAAIMSQVRSAGSSVPSAARGYDIPGGINPLTQLHEREMVLPAKHADVIRKVADEGDGARGPGVHVNIYAADARDVERLLVNNSDAVAKSVRAALRDGSLTGRDFRG